MRARAATAHPCIRATTAGKCDGLYLTYITKDYDGDVLLPPFEHLFSLAEVLENTGDLEFRRYERLTA